MTGPKRPQYRGARRVEVRSQDEVRVATRGEVDAWDRLLGQAFEACNIIYRLSDALPESMGALAEEGMGIGFDFGELLFGEVEGIEGRDGHPNVVVPDDDIVRARFDADVRAILERFEAWHRKVEAALMQR